MFLTALVSLLLPLLSISPADGPDRSPAVERSVRPEARAAALLHAWDVRRARAWASGDVGALGSLYTDRSAAGRADVAMLHAWTERGLRVTGLRTQLLSISVVAWGERRVVVDVVDRVAGGRIRPDGGVLPADRPTARRIVLERDAGEWRVARVS